MNLLLPLILAAVVTVLLIPLLERRAKALRIVDAPAPRKVHIEPVPRVGGIAMAVGAALPLLLWLPMDRQLASILLAALVVLAFGVWDDRSNLQPEAKLLGQSIAVAIVVFGGDVTIHSMTLMTRIELPPFVVYPLTFVFLLGVTNAINLSDGLDGLAGGTTLLCCAAIAALSLAADSPLITVIALAFMGSVLGFLRYNSYPARVFMGDGGSQLLGFVIGVLSIELTQGSDVPYATALPLLLLGLPIVDTLTVIAVRLSEGRSPFDADRNHLHHRLLDRGLDHFEAVAVIYVLQSVMFVLAWLLRFQSDLVVVPVFAACALAVVGGLMLAERRGWTWQGGGVPRLAIVLPERLQWLKAPARLPRWGNAIAWVMVSIYLLMVALRTSHISVDIGWLAFTLVLLLLTALFRLVPLRIIGGLVHAAVFVAMAMAVYLDHFETAPLRVFTVVKWVLFPVLAIAVVMRLRFWRERRFELTPLDVLVVFLALVLPNLPGLQTGPSNVGLSVAKLLVLMYAVEMLLRHSERTRAWLWATTALALGLIALRGLGIWAA